jgi:hypothetical protein
MLRIIDNYHARLLTLDEAPLRQITVVYCDEVHYAIWLAEYKYAYTTAEGKTTTCYEQAFGATPEGATIALLKVISGKSDES